MTSCNFSSSSVFFSQCPHLHYQLFSLVNIDTFLVVLETPFYSSSVSSSKLPQNQSRASIVFAQRSSPATCAHSSL